MYESSSLLWPFLCEPLPLPTQHVMMMMDGRRRQKSGTVHGSVSINLAQLHAYHQHEQLQDSSFWCVQLSCSPVINNYVASLIDTVGSEESKFHWITSDIYKAPHIPMDPKLLHKLNTAMHQPHLRDQYIFLGKCKGLSGEKDIYSAELQNVNRRGTRKIYGTKIIHRGSTDTHSAIVQNAFLRLLMCWAALVTVRLKDGISNNRALLSTFWDTDTALMGRKGIGC